MIRGNAYGLLEACSREVIVFGPEDYELLGDSKSREYGDLSKSELWELYYGLATPASATYAGNSTNA